MKKTTVSFLTSAKATCLVGLLTLCSSPSADAADSSVGTGEIAIYSEATGADAITTADFTHDFDTTDREDAGSFTRAGANITLNRTGHYLAIYNSRFDRTGAGTNRVETQSHLRLNATDLASGWSQGYTRWDNNQRATITAGMAVFEATATDVLQLHSFRTDNNGGATEDRVANGTAIQLVKLDDVNMGFARLSLAANVAGPTTDAFVKVPYDTDDEVGAGFTHGVAGDLTLVDGGKYLVIANTYGQQTSNRTSLVQRLTLDGTEVAGSKTDVYLRHANNANQGAAGIGMIIDATANQVLRVEGALDVNITTLNYIGGRCALTVVKLDDAAEYVRLTNTSNQNVNAATDTPLTFDSPLEVNALSFTHSTSEVTVQQDGDYLFFASVYGPNDGVQRGFPSQGWSINGASRSIAGQTGRFTRNLGGDDEFGNAGGLVASGLSASDTIEFVSSALGNGGTNNSNPIALQGVRLASLITLPATFEVIVDPALVAVTEGGATATYDLSLGLDPASGSVEVTVTSDADTEVSLDGTNFFASVAPTFTAGGVPQTVTVRAFDDVLIEGPEPAATISHAITTTSDPTNYPTSLAAPDVLATVTDDDVVPVNAIDDTSTTNANEDVVGTEALTGNLLANDTDGLNNFISASDSASTEGATVNVLAGGTFTYDPTGAASAQALALGGSLVDTFTYTATDAEGNTDTATVSITVDGANDAPEALPDALNDGPLENASSYISSVDLTANDGSYRLNPTPLTFPTGTDLRTLSGITTLQTPSVGTPPGNGFPGNALDGNFGNFTHTNPDNTVDHTWEVDFGQDVSLENVRIYNRNGCCGLRLRDITVTVLDAGGSTIFTSALLNPANIEAFVGLTAEQLFVDFAGPITGRKLVITRTPDAGDANVSDGSVLSLGEVTIIGSVPGLVIDVDDLLLNYDAANSAGTGRWENLGSSGGTNADWVLTDVTLDPAPGSVRPQISAAYEWDNILDRAVFPSGPGTGNNIAIQSQLDGTEDTEDATWEFWVKPANTTQLMTIFETGGGTGFGCVIDNGVLEAATEFDGITQNGSYVSYNLLTDPLGLVGGDPTTDFNQYAVAITVNGGLALYVNGVKVDETSGGATIGDWDGGDGAGLGRFAGANHGGYQGPAAGLTYDAPFLGQMAIVRLYSGALTPARVFQNFRAVSGDTDIDGDTITATGVIDGADTFVAISSPATIASGAIVTMTNATGGFDYNPNGVFSLAPGETATDTFTYRVTDGNGETAEADVTLTVTGVISAIDDNLLANEEQANVFFANAIVGNDDAGPVADTAYLNLSPANISGAVWTNTGTSGTGRNGSGIVSVSAQELESNFGALGTAATVGSVLDLDPISLVDATLEVWFKPAPGQTGKKTIFETGGNGIGFSLVFDPSTNEVIATIDGGDDTTQAVVAVVPGVVMSDFNQVIVTFDIDGGLEVGVATGIFEDIMTIYLNSDPATAFDATADATIVDPEGDANDWSGSDDCGINRVTGTSARNENFPGMAGEVAIVRAYARILTPTEMELNYDSAVQPITSVTSPTATQSKMVTLNADGSVTVDYTTISLATGASLLDSFDYTIDDGAGGAVIATANIVIDGNTIQEDWRFLYYGDIANSGPGEDSLMVVNGLTNLQNFAFELDPTAPAGVLDINQVAMSITSLGPPSIWTDPATGRIYLQHTRRTDFAAIPLTITDEFSRNPGLPFEASASPPTVIATGTGDGGAAIEAVQTEFPFVLPISGGKGRYGRVDVTTP